MSDGDRRQDLRREEDQVIAHRVLTLEEQIRTFAPVATTVAIQSHQIDEGDRRMSSLEAGLKDAQRAADDLLECLNAVKLRVEGMSVRLALIVGLGGIFAGAAASVVVALVTKS